MTPEQKEHAIELLLRGDQLEAVRYLQQTLSINPDQALLLAEKLEQEVDDFQESELLNEYREANDQQQQPSGGGLGKIIGLSFMIGGLVMLSVVIYLIIYNYNFIKGSTSTMGKLISYDSYFSDSENGGSTMYTPIFEYHYQGVKRTYKSSTSSSSRSFEIGEQVEVLVDPENPNSVMVNTFWEQWFLPLVLGFMGCMFSGLGYMAYRTFG